MYPPEAPGLVTVFWVDTKLSIGVFLEVCRYSKCSHISKHLLITFADTLCVCLEYFRCVPDHNFYRMLLVSAHKLFSIEFLYYKNEIFSRFLIFKAFEKNFFSEIDSAESRIFSNRINDFVTLITSKNQQAFIRNS